MGYIGFTRVASLPEAVLPMAHSVVLFDGNGEIGE